MDRNNVKLFGFASWRLVPLEPRHNTWHNALFRASKTLNIDLEYLGLVNTYKTDWITQVLPDSVLRKFPYFSFLSFIKLVKLIRREKAALNIFYIFEGSLFWVFLLTTISMFVPNTVVICNLFSSSRYNARLFRNETIRFFYLLAFKLIQKNKRAVVTFDTQLMTNKFNRLSGFNLIRFPVPSSFPFKRQDVISTKTHQRVLINLRSFPLEKLHFLLQNSCKKCTFVFPRGPLASVPLSLDFGKYANAEFDENVVPVSEYQNYIDSFDYMVFLYEPSIDASGRILDSITRGVPTCIPRQASEWSYIAKTWGKSNLFDWNSLQDISQAFNHPIFTLPTLNEEPPFTPEGTLVELIQIASRNLYSDAPYSKLLQFFSVIALIFHSVVFSILSIAFTIFFRTRMTISRLLQ